MAEGLLSGALGGEEEEKGATARVGPEGLSAGLAVRTTLVSLLIALLASGCAAVGSPIQKRCFQLNESSEKDIGYCQAVRVGNTLYIAGTAGQGEMGSAILSVYDRLQKTLEANGLTFANVVKENVYTTNLDAFILNKELRKKFYGHVFPVATWVQVQRLYVPSLVLEVELTAVYGK